jgi:hypothetical protein
MAPYIYKRNREGIHIINVGKTWEKLMLAARVIASIPNPKDILVSHHSYKLTHILNDLPASFHGFMDWDGHLKYRSYLAESMHREPCLSLEPTPSAAI